MVITLFVYQALDKNEEALATALWYAGLLNLFKNNIGKISKAILERACKYANNGTAINQRKNTKDAIQSKKEK